MKIVNMKNYPVYLACGNTKIHIGFAIINENGDFLSVDGKSIYIPCGGRKALKSLLPIADQFSFVKLH